MTPTCGSLDSLQFKHWSLCLDAPGHVLAGAGEGRRHKNPIVTIIIGIYPLSFYGAGAVNVYPLQNDPPLPIGCSLVCPVGLVWKAFEFTPILA